MKCPLAEKGCGGCRELTRMYGDVLHEKDAAFRALFPDALPILGMAEPRAYRNKVLRTFANGKSGLYHGIYRAGTHQVISVRRCLMENERANEIANIALSLQGFRPIGRISIAAFCATCRCAARIAPVRRW